MFYLQNHISVCISWVFCRASRQGKLMLLPADTMYESRCTREGSETQKRNCSTNRFLKYFFVRNQRSVARCKPLIKFKDKTNLVNQSSISLQFIFHFCTHLPYFFICQKSLIMQSYNIVIIFSAFHLFGSEDTI